MGFLITGVRVYPTIKRARYETNDTLTQVEAGGYFIPAWQAFGKGTILDVVAELSGTPRLRSYVITASSSDGVLLEPQS